jgi:hypothetical protein
MIKRFFFVLTYVAIALIAQSCITSHASRPAIVKKAPPGQVKKVTGSQSAKPYAPGQQKKKH